MALRHDWICRLGADESGGVTYGHMVNIEVVRQPGASPVLCAAFQASTRGSEGADAQHLRFTRSADGGQSWEPTTVAMWGLLALWAPILHYDEERGVLLLFYCESRKMRSPGGDIKVIESADVGTTWGPPRVLLAHEHDGGVPKVLANRVCVTPTGRWVLPFWREPLNSYLDYPSYHPMKDAPGGLEREPLEAPPGAGPEGRESSAGVLVSDDRGATWAVRGRLRDETTWLIENTVAPGEGGLLVMLLRTGRGRVYQSVSADDGDTWGPAAPTALPNPNSKVSVAADAGGVLWVAYNHSDERRAPLHLAACRDGRGAAWEPRAVELEADAGGHFAYPTVLEWEPGVLKCAYSVWGEGLRLATVAV